jgi:hypothetical protein
LLTKEKKYKLQNTNYKQKTNHKLQIINKEVSFGQILNASGEEHEMVSFIKPDRAVCNFGYCNLGFVCILSYGPCPFFEQGYCNFIDSGHLPPYPFITNIRGKI